MDSESGSKINKLLRKWPPGAIATPSWLKSQGVYQQLVHQYEKGAWVRRVGQGAYVRYADKVEWPGGLYALQEQLGLPIHAGGKTALQLQGYAHYLPLGQGAAVSLFGAPATKLPAWFRQYKWGAKIRYAVTGLFAGDQELGLTQHPMGSFAVRVSAPERAIMEVLYFVPKEETYEEAKLLMEGLTTLRPRLVQSLLQQCNSYKVKRLFMVLATVCGHRWVSGLHDAEIDFGKGKLSLTPGGQFYSKYKISVPESKPQRISRNSRA